MNCDRCGNEIEEDYRTPWSFGKLEFAGTFCSPACHKLWCDETARKREEFVERYADTLENMAGIVDKAKGTDHAKRVREARGE